MARETLTMLFRHANGSTHELAQQFVGVVLGCIDQCVSHDGDDAAAPIAGQRARDVVTYIKQHINDPDLSLGKIASAFRLSNNYIYTILRRQGIQFSKYVWDERLHHAHERICDRRFAHQTIANIAFAAGFNSNSHFSRSFRKRYGISPSMARKDAKGVDALHGVARPTPSSNASDAPR